MNLVYSVIVNEFWSDKYGAEDDTEELEYPLEEEQEIEFVKYILTKEYGFNFKLGIQNIFFDNYLRYNDEFITGIFEEYENDANTYFEADAYDWFKEVGYID